MSFRRGSRHETIWSVPNFVNVAVGIRVVSYVMSCVCDNFYTQTVMSSLRFPISNKQFASEIFCPPHGPPSQNLSIAMHKSKSSIDFLSLVCWCNLNFNIFSSRPPRRHTIAQAWVYIFSLSKLVGCARIRLVNFNWNETFDPHQCGGYVCQRKFHRSGNFRGQNQSMTLLLNSNEYKIFIPAENWIESNILVGLCCRVYLSTWWRNEFFQVGID